MYIINILTKQTLDHIQRNIEDQIEPDVLPFLGGGEERANNNFQARSA